MTTSQSDHIRRAPAGALRTAPRASSRRAFCALGLGFGALALTGLAGCGAAPLDEAGGDPEESPAGAAVADDAPTGSDAPSASSAAEPVKLSTFALNTLISITAYGVDETVVEECLAECARYEDLFSARKDGTDVARINQAGGTPVEVDPDTADLLARSLEYCALSDGAFDVTIGAVSLLWDFVEGVKPSDEAIQEALPHVDYTKLTVDGTTVTLADPDARIDLGGIAKGWIARRLVDRLEEAGSAAALVNLGTSSTYALGAKPDGSPWRIGLRDPRGSLGSIMGIVDVADASLTSSGLYDQEFELDGRMYWHILDTATGYPAETDMLGVTLVADDPVLADAFSTILFTKGIAGGTAWLEERFPEIGAMFVGEDDEPVFANGFAEDYGYEAVASADEQA